MRAEGEHYFNPSTSFLKRVLFKILCGCAGVVKRVGLKILWLSACEGSNPFTRISMSKKRDILILAISFILLLSVNYRYIDSWVVKNLELSETTIVQRIIDGDTIVAGNDTHIRMLGINTPEKKEVYYKEAKDFLEKLVLNKTINLEFGKDKFDKYRRTLAYISIDGENVNKKLVEEGFANYYFPAGKDKHYEEFRKAWEKCIEQGKNLCEFSKDKCSKCISLKNFDYKNQKIIFYNNCNFECNLTGWKIKDEGRKNFIFPNFILSSNSEVIIQVENKTNNGNNLFWAGEDYVWTKTGDTLFLRDSNGELILWEGY